MKVGIIAPIKFLDRYCITSTQYCLPLLLVTHKDYLAFYKKRKRKGDTIILDCKGTGWRRLPEDFKVIKEALKLIQPDIVIAPSYMFDRLASIEVFGSFKKEFPKLKNVVRCIEGSSRSDCLAALGVLAVPSHMYRYLKELTLGPNTIFIENHLSLDELDGRQGTLVTSLPFRLGSQGRLISDYKPSPSSLTFYEEEDNYPKVIMKNISDTVEYFKEVKEE